MLTPEMEALARDFAARLVALVEADLIRRVQGAITSSFLVSMAAPAGSFKHGLEGEASPNTRRALKLSARTLSIRRLQGQYLGVLRRLAPAARERVRRVAKEKGVAAAVAFGKSLK